MYTFTAYWQCFERIGRVIKQVGQKLPFQRGSSVIAIIIWHRSWCEVLQVRLFCDQFITRCVTVTMPGSEVNIWWERYGIKMRKKKNNICMCQGTAACMNISQPNIIQNFEAIARPKSKTRTAYSWRSLEKNLDQLNWWIFGLILVNNLTEIKRMWWHPSRQIVQTLRYN